MPVGQHHGLHKVFKFLVLLVLFLLRIGLVAVFKRLLHHAIVLLVLIVGGEILAVFLQCALDGNAVDVEKIRHHRCVFFGVAFAVGLDRPVGDAAFVFFALGGQLVLIGEGPLQQFAGVGQRRIRARVGRILRGARQLPAQERRMREEATNGWRFDS